MLGVSPGFLVSPANTMYPWYSMVFYPKRCPQSTRERHFCRGRTVSFGTGEIATGWFRVSYYLSSWLSNDRPSSLLFSDCYRVCVVYSFSADWVLLGYKPGDDPRVTPIVWQRSDPSTSGDSVFGSGSTKRRRWAWELHRRLG